MASCSVLCTRIGIEFLFFLIATTRHRRLPECACFITKSWCPLILSTFSCPPTPRNHHTGLCYHKFVFWKLYTQGNSCSVFLSVLKLITSHNVHRVVLLKVSRQPSFMPEQSIYMRFFNPSIVSLYILAIVSYVEINMKVDLYEHINVQLI